MKYLFPIAVLSTILSSTGGTDLAPVPDWLANSTHGGACLKCVPTGQLCVTPNPACTDRIKVTGTLVTPVGCQNVAVDEEGRPECTEDEASKKECFKFAYCSDDACMTCTDLPPAEGSKVVTKCTLGGSICKGKAG
jgi:hypothetical protein